MNQLQVPPGMVADVILLATQLGAMRALTGPESLILERAIRLEAVGARNMPERPVRRWERDEDRELRRMANRRVMARMIAQKLGRTPNAIYRRAQVLGISLRKGGGL